MQGADYCAVAQPVAGMHIMYAWMICYVAWTLIRVNPLHQQSLDHLHHFSISVVMLEMGGTEIARRGLNDWFHILQ